MSVEKTVTPGRGRARSRQLGERVRLPIKLRARFANKMRQIRQTREQVADLILGLYPGLSGHFPDKERWMMVYGINSDARQYVHAFPGYSTPYELTAIREPVVTALRHVVEEEIKAFLEIYEYYPGLQAYSLGYDQAGGMILTHPDPERTVYAYYRQEKENGFQGTNQLYR